MVFPLRPSLRRSWRVSDKTATSFISQISAITYLEKKFYFGENWISIDLHMPSLDVPGLKSKTKICDIAFQLSSFRRRKFFGSIMDLE